MLLVGKNIIITGASKGIGHSCALKLAQEGASLFLVSRDIKALTVLAEEIKKKYNTGVFIFQVDVTNKDEVAEFFAELNQRKILIDVLVNNAGIMTDSSLFTSSDALIRSAFETNVFASINFTQSALKPMIKNKSGSIIFISSVIATKGSSGQSIYGASKSALIGLTKSLSKELGALRIRVNAIAPGFIQTNLTSHYSDEQVKKITQSISLKRLGSPIDVSNVVAFLASDLSSYVTGQVIEVDGGMVI